ncbi:MAG: peptidylprolyl isomerase [Acidimicrobiia bacterium]|nr:peptidylprolyl isomerase [Acidimicrobiia bacterium]
MGTDKRSRQKANRAAAIDHARAEAARRQRNQRVLTYGAMALVAVFFLGLVWFLVTRDDDDVVSNEPPPTDTTVTDTSATDAGDPAVPVVITTPPPGDTITGATECPPDDGSAPRTTTFEQAPPMCIDPAKDYEAEMLTSLGPVTLHLDAEIAPETVNNFVVLSRYHYYDGVPYHRVITDFMIQGGDATGNPPGTGGPGYTFGDELPGDDYVYQPGDLAMANSGPDTNGSQFFIVTNDDGVDWLAGAHTLFGTVTEGMAVVDEIEALDAGDSNPTAEVVIESITVTEIERSSTPTTTGAPAATG